MTPKHTDISDYFAQNREPRVRNADNEWLGSTWQIGGVDEINGPGAAEVPGFIPTRHELLGLARYWANVAIDIEYFWFCTKTVGSDDSRRNLFAWRRVGRIRELLGDAVSKVVDKVYEEYGKKTDPKRWKVFLNGTDEECKSLQQEIAEAFDEGGSSTENGQ